MNRIYKRLIFILLYQDGYWCISRNFRIQRIGGLDWLKVNYGFECIAGYIDELIVLNVSKSTGVTDKLFLQAVREITEKCFVPVTVGGGIKSLQDCEKLFREVADKICVNRIMQLNAGFIHSIADLYGAQSIVGSIDVALKKERYVVVGSGLNGREDQSLSHNIEYLASLPIGECLIQSIDRDGTGYGLDLNLVDSIGTRLPHPVIIAGGLGKKSHLSDGLRHSSVDAVATAHLLNFVGNGLETSRLHAIESGCQLP